MGLDAVGGVEHWSWSAAGRDRAVSVGVAEPLQRQTVGKGVEGAEVGGEGVESLGGVGFLFGFGFRGLRVGVAVGGGGVVVRRFGRFRLVMSHWSVISSIPIP